MQSRPEVTLAARPGFGAHDLQRKIAVRRMLLGSVLQAAFPAARQVAVQIGAVGAVRGWFESGHRPRPTACLNSLLLNVDQCFSGALSAWRDAVAVRVLRHDLTACRPPRRAPLRVVGHRGADAPGVSRSSVGSPDFLPASQHLLVCRAMHTLVSDIRVPSAKFGIEIGKVTGLLLSAEGAVDNPMAVGVANGIADLAREAMSGKVRSEDPLLRSEVLIVKQEFLVDRTGRSIAHIKRLRAYGRYVAMASGGITYARLSVKQKTVLATGTGVAMQSPASQP